ncbi:unnamed protein product [Ostreobium quekettii]|uniref:Uncharacterized protein n=1 Tax=Ostreobium quekettii TaxID=121088 RepID=A0A8S1JAA8_9CHLO|nr:unnamed protein product [Ostreobium quekettii]
MIWLGGGQLLPHGRCGLAPGSNDIAVARTMLLILLLTCGDENRRALPWKDAWGGICFVLHGRGRSAANATIATKVCGAHLTNTKLRHAVQSWQIRCCSRGPLSR